MDRRRAWQRVDRDELLRQACGHDQDHYVDGWPLGDYRDPDHPPQLAILQTIEDPGGAS
jgi:hypothetical protein